MAADGIRRRVAEDLFGAAIEMDDALRRVDGDDRVGCDGKNAGELGLGRQTFLLNATLLSQPRAQIEVLDDQ
jgi:hypothetical protein